MIAARPVPYVEAERVRLVDQLLAEFAIAEQQQPHRPELEQFREQRDHSRLVLLQGEPPAGHQHRRTAE